MNSELMGKEKLQEIAERISTFAKGGGATYVRINASWHGSTDWIQNHISTSSDRSNIVISVGRRLNGGVGYTSINQITDSAFEAAVRRSENVAGVAFKTASAETMNISAPTPGLLSPELWSQATADITGAERSKVVASLISRNAELNIVWSGNLETRTYETMGFSFGSDGRQAYLVKVNDAGERVDESEGGSADSEESIPHAENPNQTLAYLKHSEAKFSVTAEDSQKLVTPWAGVSSFDWSRLNIDQVVATVREKCGLSIARSQLEPGRYTVVFEPQAVAMLANNIVESLDRVSAERGSGPFFSGADRALKIGRTKLGRKVLDERITIGHDPMDPDLGVLPFPGLRPVTWIDKGILTNLAYDRNYARQSLRESEGNYRRPSFKMNGSEKSISDLIASTEKGIVVSRISRPARLSQESGLITGFTIGGIMIIEEGKIKSISDNMRFIDSPLYLLNSVDDIGKATTVFNPSASELSPIIVPSIKARDFALTAKMDSGI